MKRPDVKKGALQSHGVRRIRDSGSGGGLSAFSGTSASGGPVPVSPGPAGPCARSSVDGACAGGQAGGPRGLDGVWPDILERSGPGATLRESSARWAGASKAPLVVMIDEIDALVGDSLLSVLRQLRAGNPDRPERFPQSAI